MRTLGQDDGEEINNDGGETKDVWDPQKVGNKFHYCLLVQLVAHVS